MDRLLTTKQVELYRLMSSDFEGLTTAEAAARLGVTPREIQRMLKRMEAVAPQLFPLLTKQEAQVLAYTEIDGMAQVEIAEQMELSEPRVSQIIRTLVAKGKLPGVKRGRAVSYDPSMDNKVKYKF